MWKVIIQCQKENSRVRRLHQDATSLKIPVPKASGDRAQSKEDDDMMNFVVSGSRSHSEHGDEGGRKLQETFDNNHLTHFSVSTATWRFLAPECTWTSVQMSRSVESSITRVSERFLLNFSDGCLADGEWDNHSVLEEPIGSILAAAVHVFSNSPDSLKLRNSSKISDMMSLIVFFTSGSVRRAARCSFLF